MAATAVVAVRGEQVAVADPCAASPLDVPGPPRAAGPPGVAGRPGMAGLVGLPGRAKRRGAPCPAGMRAGPLPGLVAVPVWPEVMARAYEAVLPPEARVRMPAGSEHRGPSPQFHPGRSGSIRRRGVRVGSDQHRFARLAGRRACPADLARVLADGSHQECAAAVGGLGPCPVVALLDCLLTVVSVGGHRLATAVLGSTAAPVPGVRPSAAACPAAADRRAASSPGMATGPPIGALASGPRLAGPARAPTTEASA
jgi:hypothetical protein